MKAKCWAGGCLPKIHLWLSISLGKAFLWALQDDRAACTCHGPSSGSSLLHQPKLTRAEGSCSPRLQNQLQSSGENSHPPPPDAGSKPQFSPPQLRDAATEALKTKQQLALPQKGLPRQQHQPNSKAIKIKHPIAHTPLPGERWQDKLHVMDANPAV